MKYPDDENITYSATGQTGKISRRLYQITITKNNIIMSVLITGRIREKFDRGTYWELREGVT